MAKIDRVTNLPKWFDLEKYKDAQLFGAAEWVYHLRNRWHLFDTLDEMSKEGITFEKLSEKHHWLKKQIEDYRTAPLKTESGVTDFLSNPVRDMTVGDIAGQNYFSEHTASQGNYTSNEVLLWELIASDPASKKEGLAAPIGLMETPMCSSAPVMVDLRATDSVLVSAFAAWLKNERNKQPAHAHRKRELPAYKDWASFGLLPYLDLTIWEIETGNKITTNTMAQAVGYFRGGDSFRKTVPALATKLMTDLTELEYLAASEMKN